MHSAAQHNNQKIVSTLIEQKADVNVANAKGETPLHAAVMNDHEDIAKLLIESGANTNTTIDSLPIEEWADKNGKLKAAKIVGAKAIKAESKLIDENSPITHLPEMLAPFIASFLHDDKAYKEFNKEQAHNKSLLKAAREGNLEGVKQELAATDVNEADGNGNTALHWAAENGHTEVVRLLLKHSNINLSAKNTEEKTSEQVAKESYYPEVAEIIRRAMEKKFIEAAKAGDLATVKNLLQAGVSINAVDEEGETALHHAAKNNHVKVVEKLLTAPGIEINKTSEKNGGTALHWAASRGYKEVIYKLLKDFNVNINKTDKQHKTADQVAGERRHFEVAKIIRGAIAKEKKFIEAVKKGDLANVDNLLQAGVNVNAGDEKGYTALHWAVGMRHTDVVIRLLATAGINVDSKPNNKEETALILAARLGNKTIVDKLLKSGANVNLTDKAGYTALHWAGERGHVPTGVMESLVAHPDIDFSIKDTKGRTAALVAQGAGFYDEALIIIKAESKAENKHRVSGAKEKLKKLKQECRKMPVETKDALVDYAEENGFNSSAQVSFNGPPLRTIMSFLKSSDAKEIEDNEAGKAHEPAAPKR